MSADRRRAALAMVAIRLVERGAKEAEDAFEIFAGDEEVTQERFTAAVEGLGLTCERLIVVTCG